MRYITFSFKIDSVDPIHKKAFVVSDYDDVTNDFNYECKRKLQFCLDRYLYENDLEKFDYNELDVYDIEIFENYIIDPNILNQYFLYINTSNENFKNDYFIYNGDKYYFVKNDLKDY